MFFLFKLLWKCQTDTFSISLQFNTTNVWRSRILNNQTMTPAKTLRNPKCAFSNFYVQLTIILGIRNSAPGFNLCRCDHEKNFRWWCGPVLHGLLHFTPKVSYAARAAALLPERPQKKHGFGDGPMWWFLVCFFFFRSLKKNTYHPSMYGRFTWIVWESWLTCSIMRVTLFFVGSFCCFSPTWKVPSEHIWSN